MWSTYFVRIPHIDIWPIFHFWAKKCILFFAHFQHTFREFSGLSRCIFYPFPYIFRIFSASFLRFELFQTILGIFIAAFFGAIFGQFFKSILGHFGHSEPVDHFLSHFKNFEPFFWVFLVILDTVVHFFGKSAVILVVWAIFHRLKLLKLQKMAKNNSQSQSKNGPKWLQNGRKSLETADCGHCGLKWHEMLSNLSLGSPEHVQICPYFGKITYSSAYFSAHFSAYLARIPTNLAHIWSAFQHIPW